MFDDEFKKLLVELSKSGQEKEEPKILTEEEEADEIVRRLATHPTPPSDFRNIVLPMIRKVMPGIIASEIMGVQPMHGPVGEIREIKYNHKDADDGKM